MEKIYFSLKLFSSHFYGQSFIKTVRGPCYSLISDISHCVSLKIDLWRIYMQSVPFSCEMVGSQQANIALEIGVTFIKQ